MGAMRTRRATVLVVVAITVTVLGTSGWVSFREARAAMARQVQLAQEAAAHEGAGDVAAALASARAGLESLARSPALTGAVSAGRWEEVDALLALLSPHARTGAAVRTPTGEGTAVGHEPVVAGEEPVFRPGRVALTAPVADGDGPAIARVLLELDLATLGPLSSPPFPSHGGRAALVGPGGEVLWGSGPVPAGSSRLGARAPVPGTELAVVVDSDRSAAHTPADALGRRLGLLVVARVGVLTVLLVYGTFVLRHWRRELEAQRRSATALASTDPLTGLANRRGFDNALAASEGPVAVVVADLDHLKEINDSVGHSGGDEALRAVGAAIRSSIRPEDLAARVGGDEFAILLPGGDRDLAAEVAARVRRAVQVGPSPRPQPISVSVGVASAGTGPPGAAGAVEALAEADRSLYAAKAARRSSPGLWF